jgi:hypothetical protein
MVETWRRLRPAALTGINSGSGIIMPRKASYSNDFRNGKSDGAIG